MIDTKKLQDLAKIIVNYSVAVKPDEKVVIKAYGFETSPLVQEVYKAALKAKALKVKVDFSTDELSRVFYEHATDKQLTYITDLEKELASDYDCMIQIVGGTNPYELSHIHQDILQKHRSTWKPVQDALINKKWVLFYYPTPSSAALAKRDLNSWEDFVFDSCLVEWPKEVKKQETFISILKTLNTISVKGKETDITYGVKGQIWQVCAGTHNLPDGEVFTSPIKTSVNGTIHYNVPTIYRSKDFSWVKLTYKDGKVVESDSDNKKDLDTILDTDEGSRYIGELAFGLNKAIQAPTKQILYDEKMDKSMHNALGKCYDDAPNGNDSINHWDLIFRFPEANASVYFDDVLVYNEGTWVNPRLTFLN